MRRYANKFHFTNLQIDYLCFFESFSTQSGKSSTQSTIRPFTNSPNTKNTKNTQSNNTNDVIPLKDSFEINSKKKQADDLKELAEQQIKGGRLVDKELFYKIKTLDPASAKVLANKMRTIVSDHDPKKGTN